MNNTKTSTRRKINLHFQDDSITNDRDLVENEADVDGPWGDEVWEAEAEAEAAEAEVEDKVEEIKERLKAANRDRGPQPVFGRVEKTRIVKAFETARDCARIAGDITEAVNEVYASLASSVEDRSKWEDFNREYNSRELCPAEAEAVEETRTARIRAEAARSEAAASAAFSALSAIGAMALEATVRNTDFRKGITAVATAWARGAADRTLSRNAERLARLQARLSEAEALAHSARAKANKAAKKAAK